VSTRRGCPGHARHWFSVYGYPGLRAPACQRGCGAKNPRPLSEQEQTDYDFLARHLHWTASRASTARTNTGGDGGR
jgi:hypothetical protein